MAGFDKVVLELFEGETEQVVCGATELILPDSRRRRQGQAQMDSAPKQQSSQKLSCNNQIIGEAYLSFRQSLVSLSALFLLLVVTLQAVVAVEEELELSKQLLQVIVVFLALV